MAHRKGPALLFWPNVVHVGKNTHQQHARSVRPHGVTHPVKCTAPGAGLRQMCQGRVTPEAKAGLPPLKRLVTACRRATLDPQRGRCKPVLSWHTARRPSTGRVLTRFDPFRSNGTRRHDAVQGHVNATKPPSHPSVFTPTCHLKWPGQYNLSECAPFDNSSFEKNNVVKTMLEDERKVRFGIWATTLSVRLQPCRTHGFMPWLEQLPTWSLVLSWLWPSRKTPWPIARARRSCSGRSCVAKCGACWQERKPTTRAKCKTTWCHPSGSMHSTGSSIKTDVPRKSDARSQSWTFRRSRDLSLLVAGPH